MKILRGGSILERVENANGMVLIEEYELEKRGSESRRSYDILLQDFAFIFYFKLDCTCKFF